MLSASGSRRCGGKGNGGPSSEREPFPSARRAPPEAAIPAVEADVLRRGHVRLERAARERVGRVQTPVLPDRQTARREDPDVARGVLVDPEDGVAGKSLRGRVGRENAIAIADRAAIDRADPQVALAILPEDVIARIDRSSGSACCGG